MMLRDAGVEHLALAIFTHPDADHLGGAAEVLSRFSVEEIWVPTLECSTEEACEVLFWDAVKEYDVSVRAVNAGASMVLGSVTIEVLSPFSSNIENENEKSIVTRVLCGEAQALLMGDVGVETEMQLLGTYPSSSLSSACAYTDRLPTIRFSMSFRR